MGYSRTLAAVAIAAAIASLVATGGRRPRNVRQWVLAGACAFGVTMVGVGVASSGDGPGIFGLAHVGYLTAVVTLPLIVFGWLLRETHLVRGRPDRLTAACALMGALAVAVGIWGTHVEPNRLRIDRQQLALSDVRIPLRIGVLSDLQTPNVGDHEWNAVDSLIAQTPDLVVIPGDLYQGPPETIQANRGDFVAVVAKLVDATELVVIVTGDADRPDPLAEIAAESGATFIRNGIIDATVAGTDLRIAGVTVPNEFHPQPNRDRTLADLVEPTEALTLLVSHRPGVVYELNPLAGVVLIMSGHTHGGQVAIPGLGPLITLSPVPRSLAGGGLETIDDFPVYVSTGVGMERRTAPQLRLFVRPSIGIIDALPATEPP